MRGFMKETSNQVVCQIFKNKFHLTAVPLFSSVGLFLSVGFNFKCYFESIKFSKEYDQRKNPASNWNIERKKY